MVLYRKCQYCNLKDTVAEEMKFEVVGVKRPLKKYYHHKCHELFLADKAFKEKERLELDGLVEVIHKLYGVSNLPPYIYAKIQDLRNGNRFFGKYDYKYKAGYSYDLIRQTFEYCSDTIERANATKNFNGSLNTALSYGLAIVCDKLSYVENRETVVKKKNQRVEAIADKAVERMGEEDEIDYEKKFKEAKSKKASSDKYNYFN